MANVVKFFLNQEVSDVPLAPNATTALPMTSTGLGAGEYVFNGVGYDCNRRGLYRFWNKDTDTIHSRVVYAGPGPVRADPDLYAFMSAIAWHNVHATQDEGLTGQNLINAGMTHKWRLRCGFVTALVDYWLSGHGYQTRKIQLLADEPFTQAVGNGHEAIELFHDGKWKLWDLTQGVYFTKDGVHLSAQEVVDVHGYLNCDQVSIDEDETRGGSVIGSWCQASNGELNQFTKAERDAWFDRIYKNWWVNP